MCIKAFMETTSLNPSAQEWWPSSHYQHVFFAPPLHYQPLPPPAAVQVVTVSAAPPPQEIMAAFEIPQLSYCHALPVNPYVMPCAQPPPRPFYHHSTFASFPASDPYFHEAATPIPNFVSDGFETVMNFSESPTTEKSPKCHPVSCGRKFFSPPPRRATRSFSMDSKSARKQEFRPRKAYSDNGLRGGAAVHSPPAKAMSIDEEFSPCSATTVMIKNIPNQLRRDYMLEFIDLYCNHYSLEYDFLYLPMDFRKRDNLGYCFVNFTSTAAAEKFKQVIHKYEWGTVQTGCGFITSNKVCETTWARIQGKQSLLKRFQASKFDCDKLDYLPVVLDPPRNGSDPIRAPPVVIGKLQKRAVSKMYY
ncbi:PREDICTED: protein MEI2-like 7 [Erythranthe guttata]|nr:PREDICTED: protein MEI2-like 7 [Erythranthe guttata]|eukprot:XP_012853338.1 PREDICTED: protein MEI2-like 7 [Erythranthe guttata]